METDTIIIDSQLLVEYRNAEKDVIYFQCFPMDESTQSEFILNGATPSDAITVNGMYGIFYQPEDSAQPNELLWFSEELNVAFQLSSLCEKQTMIQIAKSVILEDFPN